MVDKSGLQVVGWVFGGATALVILIAALLVTDAVASNRSAPDTVRPAVTEIAQVR